MSKGGGAGRPAQAPPTPGSALPGSHRLCQPGEAWRGLEAGGGLTYEATAQPCLGDGTVVGVAAQVELLVQVQALELALGSAEGGNGREARQGWGGGWERGTGSALTWEVPLTGARLPTIREP